MKKTVLIWGDSPNINTGFGMVSKNLFSQLHEQGYIVDFVGINDYGLIRNNTPERWHIYPSQKQDPLGEKNLLSLVQNNYDLIILFQDIFNISNLLPYIKEKAPNSKILTYFPVDGGPLCIAWENVLQDSDIAITYTEYAKKEILKVFPSYADKVVLLDHGIDTDIFKPLSKEKIKSIRRKFNWDGKFTVINVNRYQPRKNIAATIRIWSLFSKGYHTCANCETIYPLHMQACDSCGHTITSAKSPAKPTGTVSLYLHMRSHEMIMGPRIGSHFIQNLALNVGFTDDDTSTNLIQMPDRDIYGINSFTSEEINEMYNGAHLNISTAYGEGFGFSLAEAAATGTPSLAPNNSAIPEVLGPAGYIIPNIPNSFVNLTFDNGFTRPTIDIKKAVDKLQELYDDWVKKGSPNPKPDSSLINFVKNKYNWQDKRDFIHDQIKKLI